MKRRQGFTLLEVILAVLMIALISVTVQRFVHATLTGIEQSAEVQVEAETMTALYRYVDTQLNSLPRRGQSILLGFPHKFGERQADDLQWRCTQGIGTLTDAADGEWFVTLQLRAREEGARAYDLGLRRRPVNGGDKEWNWIPLLRDVSMLKFDYYDPLLNAWLDRWNDQNRRPLLVRMQLWRGTNKLPDTAVFTVNSARAQ